MLPDDAEVAGLLALMLLTDARRTARTGPAGELIPLNQQDRSLWDQRVIKEGIALLTGALQQVSVGSYTLQAAIAAIHDEAPRAEDTDWPQILALYELLRRMSDNPMVLLNHAVAAAMVDGPPPDSTFSTRSTGMIASPAITGSKRSAPICSNWRPRPRLPSPITAQPRTRPAASPSAITY